MRRQWVHVTDSRKRHTLLGIVAFIALAGVFALPAQVYAGFWDVVINGPQAVLSTIVNALLYGIVYVFGKLIAVTLIPALVFVASYNDFASEWGVQLGWTVVRDIANMFFIVVLLVIAVATIFKVESYSYRALMPKLIIMAILINFSRTITSFFIDISQIIMLTFVNSFRNIAAGNLINGLGLVNILQSFPEQATGDASALAAFGSMVLGVAVTVVAAGILLVLVVVLAFRIIMLWMLIVLSPMAFLLSVFPGGQKYSSQWWEKLAGHLIVGPVLAFFLWLSFTIMQNNLWTQREGSSFQKLLEQEGIKSKGEEIIVKYNPFGTTQGQLNSMINYIIVIGLLMGSLTIASQLGVLGGAIVGTVSGGLSKLGIEAAKSTGKFVDKRLKGWTSDKGFIGKGINYALAGFGSQARIKGGFGFSTPFRFAKGYRERLAEKYHDAFHGEKELGMDLADAGVLRVAQKGIGGALKETRNKRMQEQIDQEELQLEHERRRYTYIHSGGTEEDRERYQKDVTEGLKKIRAKQQDFDEKEDRFGKLDKMGIKGRSDAQDKEFKELAATVGDPKWIKDVWQPEMDKEIKALQAIAKKLYGDDTLKKSFNPDDKIGFLNLFRRGKVQHDETNNPDGSLSFSDTQDGSKHLLTEKSLDKIGEATRKQVARKILAADRERAQAEQGWVDGSQAAEQEERIRAAVQDTEKFVDARMRHKLTGSDLNDYERDVRAAHGLATRTDLSDDERQELDGIRARLATQRTTALGETDSELVKLNDRYAAHKAMEEYRKALGEEGNDAALAAAKGKIGALGKEYEEYFMADRGLDEKAKEKLRRERVHRIDMGTIALEEKKKRIDEGPGTEADAQKLVKDIKARKERLADLKIRQENIARGASFRGFYSKMAARARDQEETKKLSTIDSGELLGIYRKAEKEHDHWKMRAAMRNLAQKGNINDLINDYGYASGFQGMKQFFSEKLHVGPENQEMMELVSDLSYMLEDNGHWDMARVVKFDRSLGKLNWATEKEHVGMALAEIKKRGSYTIANLNRLGYGGEVPLPDGTLKFDISPLGKAIVNTFATDFAGRIVRGELNPNVIQNLGSVLDRLVREMPHLKRYKDPRYNQTFYDTVNVRYKQILAAQEEMNRQMELSGAVRPEQAFMYL